MTQDARFVSVEKALSFDSLANSVLRGPTLPYWASAGSLFAVNGCTGLYLSTGNHENDVPGQQIEHYTWMPVEQSPSFTHTVGFTFNRPLSDLTHPVALMKYGKSTLVLRPAGRGDARMQIENSGTNISWPAAAGWVFPVPSSLLHEQLQITVTIDPNLNSIIVEWYGSQIMINHFVAGKGPAIVQTTTLLPHTAPPIVTVANVPVSNPSSTSLCRSLVPGR
jgi:hypothetical protein